VYAGNLVYALLINEGQCVQNALELTVLCLWQMWLPRQKLVESQTQPILMCG